MSVVVCSPRQQLFALAAILSLAASCAGEQGDNVQPDPHAGHGMSAAAGDGPAPQQPEGHRRMLEMLAQIATRIGEENPYLGDALALRVRADLAAQDETTTVPERWLVRVELAGQEMRLGNEERGIELYEEALQLLGQSKDPVPHKYYLRNVYEMGVAYLRWGETVNCVKRHSSESCLLPIRGDGVHVDQRGSSNAIRYLSEAADKAQPGSHEAMRARWLINLAYMTLGSWPAEVPARFRIDPEVLESDEPMPLFPEIASELGLDSFDNAGGAIGEDFDGDGDLDLMVSTSNPAGQMRFYRNEADGTFVERTKAAGLEGLIGGLNLMPADYDNDGDVDVLVLRGAWWKRRGLHPNSLLRNNGNGTFTDVTFEAGLGEVHYPTQTAAWADYDLDGDLDLYVGNENGEAQRLAREDELPYADAPCQLFRNDGNGTFTDIATAAGVENMHFAKAVIWADYDDDRYPDLYVSNFGHLNRLYHNEGDGTFVDVAKEAGVTLPIVSFPVWFWDVNNDGSLDLYVAAYGSDMATVAASYLGMGDPGGGELPYLYLGDGVGGFRDVTREWNVIRPTLPMGNNFGDLDNDGFLDFYLGTGYPSYEALVPNRMYRNRGGTGFAEVTTAGNFGHLQKGHAVVFADFDNDGDEDVFQQMGGAWAGDAYGNAFYLNPGFGSHWIKLSLVGVHTNRFGLGARIRVDIVEDGKRRSIYRRVSSGATFGGNPFRREIGVGSADVIEAIEIYWPASDTTQRFEGVAVDQWIEATEGESDYRVLPLNAFALGNP